MRVAKPINLVVPDKLYKGLNDYLAVNEVGYHFKPEYFYFTVDYLLHLENLNKKANFVPIDLQNLKRLTVSNIDRYIRTLKNGEFIKCDNEFKPGEKSLHYQVNPKLKEGCKVIELMPENRLYKKIVAEVKKERAHDNRKPPFLKTMKKKFMAIELDYVDAEKFIFEKVEPRLQANYINSIERFKNKNLRYFKRNKTNNRLDTNLTNLSSNLKPFLSLKFSSLDLINSQPLILGLLLENIIKKLQHTTLCYYFLNSNLTKTFGKRAIEQVLLIHQNAKNSKMVDLSEYLNQVKNGTIYDDFSKAYGGLSRKEIKNIMFKVLFSKNKVYSYGKKRVPFEKEKKIFASVYPEVAAMVEALKEKDHKALPIYLQKIESFIFIDCIAKELCEKGISPLTIHDSIIIEPKYKETAKKTIEDVFKKQTGIIPKLHIENIN